MSASASPHGYPLDAQYSFQNWDWTLDNPLDAAAHQAQAQPSPAFFDSLLNPAAPYTMSSSRAQPGRLSNGYVDLTSPPLTSPHVDLTHVDRTHGDRTHVDLTDPDSPPRRRQRQSPTPGPSSKRAKHHHGTTAESSSTKSPAAPIEQIDLSQDDDMLHVLHKQREDAIRAQAKPVETVTTFNSFNCVICMDRPTDITATACGHLFCHTCLMEALIAGENRTGPGEVKRSQCPVCRKTISRTRATDVIPLSLKKALATQPRRKPDPIPAAAAPKVQ